MNQKGFQKNIFEECEGNNYFERNKEKNKLKTGYLVYKKYLKSKSKLLMIGSSNGDNLNFLKEETGCEAYGIDPSQKAIDFGTIQYPNIKLFQGTSDNLNFEDNFFDMIIFANCLSWVDRELLSKTIYEADRVLKNKGIIGIMSFDTRLPERNKYKEYNDVYTYKYDYSKIFTSYPHFFLVEKLSFSSENEIFSDDIKNRVASWVILKENEHSYMENYY